MEVQKINLINIHSNQGIQKNIHQVLKIHRKVKIVNAQIIE